jgi:hypothetical protein
MSFFKNLWFGKPQPDATLQEYVKGMLRALQLVCVLIPYLRARLSC